MSDPLHTFSPSASSFPPSSPSETPTSRSGLWITLRRGLPTLVVLSLLGAVAWWGHSTGWTLPTAADAQAQADDWCEAHGVPDSICVECHPDIYPPPQSFDACSTHGVVNCPLCHPEVAQIKGTAKLPSYDPSAAFTLVPRVANDPLCPLVRARLQLADLNVVDHLALQFDPVTERDMVESLSAPGEIIYDPQAVVSVSSPVSGIVIQVFARLGDDIEEGAVLALVDSREVAEAKAELVTACVQHSLAASRYAALQEAGIAVSANTLRNAQAEWESASVRSTLAAQVLVNLGYSLPENIGTWEPAKFMDKLRFLGVPDPIVAALMKSGRTQSSGLFPVKANARGSMIATRLVQGENAAAASEIARIANTSNVRVKLALAAKHAPFVQLRQKMTFSPDLRDATFTGHIVWVSPTIDDTTRTLEVHAVLDCLDPQTRVHEFGTGRVVLREAQKTLTVPKGSVLWDGSCSIVFVRDKDFYRGDAPKLFHVRQVRVGAQDDSFTEILAGLLPNEVVVSSGGDVLRGKLLSANLGAGCTDCMK